MSIGAVEAFDQDQVTTKELFFALVETLKRVDRLEEVLGMTMNVVLLATSDVEHPGDDVLEETLKRMSEFLERIREEHEVHVRIRSHLDFLNQPE